MNLSDKIKHLRYVEGIYRGLNRPISKAEMLRAMREELGETLSHAYLSQLESGVRTQISLHTRQLLANFFKVHPGYLVSDPEGYQPTISMTEMLGGNAPENDPLRRWLMEGAVALVDHVELNSALRRLIASPDPERYLRILAALVNLDDEELAEIEQRIAAELSVSHIEENGSHPQMEEL